MSITSVDLAEFELQARLMVAEVAAEFAKRYNGAEDQAAATLAALQAGPMRTGDQQAARRAKRVADMYHGGSDVRIR